MAVYYLQLILLLLFLLFLLLLLLLLLLLSSLLLLLLLLLSSCTVKDRARVGPPQSSRSLASSAVVSSTPTIAHTVTKGGKRMAHTPKLVSHLFSIFIVLKMFGTRLEPNHSNRARKPLS